MKKQLLFLLLSFTLVTSAFPQEYKLNKASGKLVINLSKAVVEGYSGSQIVFSSNRPESATDPRAKGLREINGSGYTDNTGLGISVTETGSTVEVNQITSDPSVKILVPKGMMVSYAWHRIMSGKVEFSNMENEIEISTDYNAVKLENVSGPVTVRSVYGAIDARFKEPVKGPIAIASIYSTVDVAIPPGTKANLKLNSTHGSILASAELKIDLEKNKEDDRMVNYSSNNVKGLLNGGGSELNLTADYGKIYLRSTK